ncbi:TetR/AcrR family transcriptional regulator [Pseudonocardia acaciae]|uniref:TetR/AcrR family transcriptional regulator n=1 Tax=Pseudonocardia acaciae TaxID=551276 RepID=UPI00048D926B|nr:TetR/AcrR family transcriptional regulator [Pseudonocardia acaciae]
MTQDLDQTRRSPGPEERKLDAERSRRLLVDAAVEEFAAKGYEGARVRDIADRAGVNKQLVNYYFGGKEGLYLEVQRHWLADRWNLVDQEVPFEDVVACHLRNTLADPRPARLAAWHGLTERGERLAPKEPEDLSATRARQDRGELADDIDLATLRLAVLGAISAPVVLPQLACRIFGVPPNSPEFERRYAEGLRTLVRHLRQAESPND